MWKWFKRIVAGLVLACFGLILLLSIPSVRTRLDSYELFFLGHLGAVFVWEEWNSFRAKPIEPIDPEDVLHRLIDPTSVELAFDQRWDGVEYLGEEAVEPLMGLLSAEFNIIQGSRWIPRTTTIRHRAISTLGVIDSPAVPKLIAALDSEDSSIRAGAAEALRWIKDFRIIEPMARLLDDPDPNLRQWAISGIGRINDPYAMKILTDALNNNDAAVRFTAAVALARFEDGRGLNEIVQQMEVNRNNHNIGIRGAGALAALHTTDSCRIIIREYRNGSAGWNEDAWKRCAHLIVPELIEMLQDKDDKKRLHAADILQATGDHRSIKPFTSLLGDEEESVRITAIEALGELRAVSAVEKIIDVELEKNHEHYKVRALVQIADPRATEYIRRAEKNSSYKYKIDATKALINIGDFRGIERWRNWKPKRWIHYEPGTYCGFRCSKTNLLHLRDVAMPFARRALRESGGYLNVFAMRILASGKDPQGLELLLEPPKFECPDDRLCYYLALGEYEDPRAQEIVGEAFDNVTTYFDLWRMVPVLERNGNPRLVTRLADWISSGWGLEYRDSLIREIAQILPVKLIRYCLVNDRRKLNSEQARYLGTIRNPDLIDPLAEALNHNDPVVQTCAAESLRNMDDPRAQKALEEARETDGGWRGQLWWWHERKIEKPDDPKALIRLLSHEDWRVREAAVQALVQLGPQATTYLLLYLSQHRVLSMRGSFLPLEVDRHDRIGLAGAATALGEIGDPRAIRNLKRLEGSENWLVALRATEALAKLQPETKVSSLPENEADSIQTLLLELDDLEASLRYDAAMSLVRIGSEAVQPLINLLEHGRRIEAAEAAFALGRIDDKRAFMPLVKALDHTDVRVRARAAEALGWHGDRRAIGELKRFRVGKEGWEQLAADWALEKLREKAALGEEVKADYP